MNFFPSDVLSLVIAVATVLGWIVEGRAAAKKRPRRLIPEPLYSKDEERRVYVLGGEKAVEEARRAHKQDLWLMDDPIDDSEIEYAYQKGGEAAVEELKEHAKIRAARDLKFELDEFDFDVLQNGARDYNPSGHRLTKWSLVLVTTFCFWQWWRGYFLSQFDNPDYWFAIFIAISVVFIAVMAVPIVKSSRALKRDLDYQSKMDDFWEKIYESGLRDFLNDKAVRRELFPDDSYKTYQGRH